jgi:small subunit ribosomal protein S5
MDLFFNKYMEDSNTKTNTTEDTKTNTKIVEESSLKPKGTFKKKEFSNNKNERKNTRKFNAKEPRAKPEFEQKMLSVRRVTRVVSGGRRFSFSVALVAGNRKGSVGVGLGKGSDTSLAINKAARDAKANMITVPLTKDFSIPYDISGKYGSARVMMRPAPGKGVVAGSAIRAVIELAGIKNITGKLLSPSKNKLNNARVAIEALKNLSRTSSKLLKVVK